MKKMICVWIAVLMVLCSLPAFAGQLRVFVNEMTVGGLPNRDELKVTLQTLLASRLNGDSIVAVGSAGEADVVVSGAYVSIGKVFSLDAVAKTTAGKTITRAFVQGETQDELITAVGKLAEKLCADLGRVMPATPPPVAASGVVPVAAPVPVAVKNDQVQAAETGEFIKPRDAQVASVASGWTSGRLVGAANLLAAGKAVAGGGREIFLAEERRLAYYLQDKEMKLLDEVSYQSNEKIISLDTIAGNDGLLDIYVTMVRSGELASQVWQVKGGKLQLVAEKLPYYFRVTALAGSGKKLYVQGMGREEDFYGEVSEAVRNGSVIVLQKTVNMPKFGVIYNFNQFRDRDGKTFTVVINPDNYLVVYDQQLQELWRSNDKYGGTELFFQKDDDSNFRITGDRFRWIFMNQRIQVSSAGEILIGKNEGFWIMGNSRTYKRGAVYCLAWNGSSLEEKWRTRDTQNYMPDYHFDQDRAELLILQTAQRPGIGTRGATSLSIKKIE